jgi:hypothetical protein
MTNYTDRFTSFTFEQVREAIQECTGYDLVQEFDDDHDQYVLVDQDGDPFMDLDDVVDYVTDNDQVNTYLRTEFN